MTRPAIYPGPRIGGDPTYDGFTLGEILNTDTFIKANWPGVRAILVNGQLILAEDLPASYSVPEGGYLEGAPTFYTASGSFAKASFDGLVAVRAQAQGGGGQGGGAAVTTSGNSAGGGGGGGGGFGQSIIPVASLATSETVTVGVGGTGGGVGNNGGNGGNSSFGSHVVGNGGAGGTAGVGAATPFVGPDGGSGGSGTGSLVLPGGDGHNSILLSGTATTGGVRGSGGNSFLGKGKAGTRATGNGSDAGNYGGGGSGGMNISTQGNARAGGSGGPGIVIVTPLYVGAGGDGTVEVWY